MRRRGGRREGIKSEEWEILMPFYMGTVRPLNRAQTSQFAQYEYCKEGEAAISKSCL
jgi:hypothetical protein